MDRVTSWTGILPFRSAAPTYISITGSLHFGLEGLDALEKGAPAVIENEVPDLEHLRLEVVVAEDVASLLVGGVIACSVVDREDEHFAAAVIVDAAG